MATRQSYPCFSCRKAGHEVQVLLDGKDSEGRTKYLNTDGTKHTHVDVNQVSAVSSANVQKNVPLSQQEEHQQSSTTVVTEPTSIKIINAKLDRIISLLESQARQQ